MPLTENNLGKALQERRKARGLTLQQVSMLTGVSAAHIGRIETGLRFPSARVLKKLAQPLGFSETELFRVAGFLSRDESDPRVDRLKQEMKEEIAIMKVTITVLAGKIDSL